MKTSARSSRRSAAWLRLGRGIGLVVILLTMAASLAVAKPGPAAKPGASGSASAAAAASGASSGIGLLGGEAPEAAYQRHLDNGIKLFQDGNYRAAITEFEAAYEAQPKASPLVNIALSHKALFDYPKAIEALRKAVTEHADTLKPEHKAAAEKEIHDLEALLATVTVAVEPQHATLLLDGLELPSDSAGKPLTLSAGPHVLEARLQGYRSTTAKITITAGERNRRIELKLAADQGKLRVTPYDTKAWVEIDGQVPVQGGFEGMMNPGVHSVRVFKHGEKADSLEVVIVAGKTQQVSQSEDGKLASDATRPEAAPGGEEEEEGERQGFFLHGHAALLFVGGTHPKGFTPDTGAAGAALGLRVGYRVADWAAFELAGQLSSVGGPGTAHFGVAGQAPVSASIPVPDVKYTLNSIRLGADLRVFAPGRFLVRFIGSIGAGLAIDHLVWTLPANPLPGDAGHSDEVVSSTVAALPGSLSGVGGYGELDLGIEFELSRVIFGLTAQSIIQSSKGLDTESYAPYKDKPVFFIGPALHVGYGFW